MWILEMALGVSAIALVLYPVIRLLNRLLYPDYLEHRQKELRTFTAQLLSIHSQMIEELNQARKEMGLEELPITPIASKFKSRYWHNLLINWKNAVESSAIRSRWFKNTLEK